MDVRQGHNAPMATLTPDLLEWLETTPWTFAKTMPTNPHEYIVERHLDGPEFLAFAQHIWDHGTDREYRGTLYRYVELGDHTYWLTEARGGDGLILNRKLTAQADWDGPPLS